MSSEFSRWFKEAVSGQAATESARNNESSQKRGERHLYATGVWNGDVAFSAELGQVVWIEVKNVNVLGTTIIIDCDRAASQRMYLPPFMSHTFEFSCLDDVDFWRFQVSTYADAFVVQYAIYSTWVPWVPKPGGG